MNFSILLSVKPLRYSLVHSTLIDIGIVESLPNIKNLLAHSQVQTTERYAHLADDPV